MKRFFTIFWRTLVWITISILLLLLLIITTVQIPYVQNKIVGKATSFLNEKIKTPVHIGKVLISFPKQIVIEDIYLEDQKKDTLLKADEISIDVGMLALIDNELNINKVEAKGFVSTIDRNTNGIFNFDYIIDAFATSDTTQTNENPMKITLGAVRLDDFRLRYSDDFSKMYLSAQWDNFFLHLDEFDMDKMQFGVDKFKTKGLSLSYKMLKSDKESIQTQENPEKEANSNSLFLALEGLRFENSDIYFLDENSNIETQLAWSELDLDAKRIALDSMDFSVQDFRVNHLQGFFKMPIAENAQKEEKTQSPVDKTSTSESLPMKINVERFRLGNSSFAFDALNKPRATKGIDFMHLQLTETTADLKGLEMTEEGIKGEISELQLTEQSGLKINKIHADFLYGAEESYIQNFEFRTPYSQIKANAKISYSSQEMLSKQPEKSKLLLDLEKIQIATRDILLFAPELHKMPPFEENSNATYYANGNIKGLIGDFAVNNLKIKAFNNTSLAVKGRVKGLPNTDNLYVDLPNIKVQSVKNEIMQFVPKNTLPDSIQLPETLLFSGNVKGTMKNITGDLSLATNLGNVKLNGIFSQKVKDNETFSLKGNIVNLQLGKILNKPKLGSLSTEIDVEGKGLNPKTMEAKGEINITQLSYNGYEYEDLVVKGNIANSVYKLRTDYHDKNAQWDLSLNGSFQGEHPSLHIDGMVEKLDLYQMKLTSSHQAFRVKIDADFEKLDPDHPIGQMKLSDFSYANGENVFPFNDMIFKSYNEKGKNFMEFNSQFIQFSAVGNYQLTSLPNSIQNTLSSYYKEIQPVSDTVSVPSQKLDVELRVSNNHMLPNIIPALDYIDPIDFVFHYNSERKNINLSGKLPTISYNGLNVKGVNIDVQSRDSLISYQTVLDGLQTDMFKLTKTSFSGTIKDDLITYNFLIKDTEEKDKYKIKGNIKTVDNGRTLDINPLKIILNYEEWDVNAKNTLLFSEKGFQASEFSMTNNNEKISLNSLKDNAEIPLEIVFEDFKLETLSHIVESELLNMSGILDGKAKINMKKSTVSADINLKKLNLLNSEVGNIHLTAENKTPEIIDLGLELTGNENSVIIDGNAHTKNGTVDLNIDINKLKMESLQAFTLGNIKKGKGYLSGKMRVQKSTKDLDLQGNIDFNNVGMVVTKLNSQFQNINDKIHFQKDKIRFDNFTVYDETNNELNVDGYVQMGDLMTFDLAVTANDFMAVNSSVTDNDMFYGQLSLNTDLTIKGNTDLPVINGSIDINDKTDFTFVLPQSDPGITDREGVVRFESEKDSVLNQTLEMKKQFNNSNLKGMDVSVNISVDKEAVTTLVIDKGNGDYLKLQGEGELTGGIDPSGNTTLTGKYTINEGAYELTLNFIKRSFKITEGSYLMWTGTPTDAQVNISAVYETNTPPIDLLGQQLSGLSANLKNQYKQNLPFGAVLKMEGQLLNPDISFDLKLDETGLNSVSSNVVNTVKTKLDQLRQRPSDLYKQVFALLLLNRFVGENPFASEVETSAASMAQQSVSRIISQQLNSWAADLIQGVDVNFDLQSEKDYSSGEAKDRTDLNVDVSKSLFDDRLKVSVGSSFGVQGETRQNEQANNIAGNILIEYALSKDGRYMLKAYRKNEYQVALQGEVVETGVGFVITMSYNKFRELFAKVEKKKTKKNKKTKK